jgi:hypothetical protein
MEKEHQIFVIRAIIEAIQSRKEVVTQKEIYRKYNSQLTKLHT